MPIKDSKKKGKFFMTGDVKKESPGLGVFIGELALKHRTYRSGNL